MARVVSGAPVKNNAAAGHALLAAIPPLAAAMLLCACATSPRSGNHPPVAAEAKGITSPASARDVILDALISRQERVYRIASPLITRNAVLCRTQARPLLGFTAKNVHSYPSELAAAARKTLGLGERLQVMQVLGGSGAQKAGMTSGDILQSIQDVVMPEGPQAENEAARVLAPLLKNLTEIRITVLRRGQPIELQVPLTLACAFAIDIGNAPNVNAYADGKRIMITRGMLEALPVDDDVAVILARELAHNVLQHARQLQQTVTVSGVIDSLLPLQPEPSSYAGSGGIKPATEKMDQEADRLAMFMLARAGYDPMHLARVSQKLADIAPASQLNSYSALHAWTEERRSLMHTILRDIHQKQSTKKALVP